MIASEVGGADRTAPMPRARREAAGLGCSWRAWWAPRRSARTAGGDGSLRQRRSAGGRNRKGRPGHAAPRDSAGHGEPNGAETECRFEYGTSKGASTKPRRAPSTPANADRGAGDAKLAGLDEGTTYYFRITARNLNGSKDRRIHDLHHASHKPRANTEAAKEVKRTTATLIGFVTPNDSEVTECYFELRHRTEERDQNRTYVVFTGTIAAGAEPSEAKRVDGQTQRLGEKTSLLLPPARQERCR